MKLWDGMNSKKFDAQMLQISAHQVDTVNRQISRLTVISDAVSALTVLHLNPKISDPQRITKIPRRPLTLPSEQDAVVEAKTDQSESSRALKGDAMDVDGDEPEQHADGDVDDSAKWTGIWSDIGILSEKQFQTIVTKCIATLGENIARLFVIRAD